MAQVSCFPEVEKLTIKRLVTLPNGRSCSLRRYCAGWRKLKTLSPDTRIGNWDDFPVEAAEILRDLHSGMHDRINRHVPGYGRGRKWDERYQTDLRRDVRRVTDYASRRLVHPANRLATPELQRRFQWRYGHDGLSIVLYNARRSWLMAIEDIGPGETRWTLAADKLLKLANAIRAVEIPLNAIAQARDEGEEIRDWLDEVEDAAIDAMRSGAIA
jgi:hypothetical protein